MQGILIITPKQFIKWFIEPIREKNIYLPTIYWEQLESLGINEQYFVAIQRSNHLSGYFINQYDALNKTFLYNELSMFISDYWNPLADYITSGEWKKRWVY